jgi:hypothetical protein
MDYNNNIVVDKAKNSVTTNFKSHSHAPSLTTSTNTLNLYNKVNLNNQNANEFALTNYLSFIEKNSLLAAENDANQGTNPLKSVLNNK